MHTAANHSRARVRRGASMRRGQAVAATIIATILAGGAPAQASPGSSAPTVRSLIEDGFTEREARSLRGAIKAGGTRRAAAERIVSRDFSAYGTSAAGLAARSDIGVPAGDIPADRKSPKPATAARSSSAAPAAGGNDALRPAAPAEGGQTSDAGADPSGGFDIPSAAIGAAGVGLILLVATAGFARRRPLTRRHGAADV